MRFTTAVLLAVLIAPAAFAHGGDGPLTPQTVWHHWNFDPWIWAPLLLGHWLYGRGITRAWRKAGLDRIVPVWRVMAFATGELLLVAALISPVDPLGETLLTAHMVQHILLTAAASPLLVLGLPIRAWTWGLPRSWRRVGSLPLTRGLVRLTTSLSQPIAATLVGALVLWVWHAPALFEGALVDPVIHTVEHMSFLLTSLLFWTGVFARGTRPIAAAGMVLVTFMAGGLLGGLLCLAPMQLYGWYGGYAQLWGMSGVEDQQLAGLAMWVPAGGIYLVAFAVFAVRVADPPRILPRRPSIGIIRASTSSRSMK